LGLFNRVRFVNDAVIVIGVEATAVVLYFLDVEVEVLVVLLGTTVVSGLHQPNRFRVEKLNIKMM
jgi:hypothetical protein